MESRRRRLHHRWNFVTAGCGREGHSAEVGSHLRFPRLWSCRGIGAFTPVLVPGPWLGPSAGHLAEVRAGPGQHRSELGRCLSHRAHWGTRWDISRVDVAAPRAHILNKKKKKTKGLALSEIQGALDGLEADAATVDMGSVWNLHLAARERASLFVPCLCASTSKTCASGQPSARKR